MGEMKNAYEVLIVKHEEKKPLQRSKLRWEDTIKTDLKKWV
jgi:hypothetical protein